MRVFADSFYFIAMLDSADAHHRAAIEYQRNRDFTITTTRSETMREGEGAGIAFDRLSKAMD